MSEPTMVCLGLLGVGFFLVIASLQTRRPIAGIVLPEGIDDYAKIWQTVHNAHDVEPKKNPLHVAYLHLTYAAATPLARLGVLPDWLTLVGLWLAGFVTVFGWMGGRFPMLAALLMIISSLTDGVDGAVAGLTNRTTARGHVLDSVVDRFSEVLFVASIVLAGGPAWAGVLAMSGIVLLEYTRARVTTAGGGAIGKITIGERPTRIIGCAFCLVGMGVAPRSVEFIGLWSLLIVAAASFVGFAQLVTSAWQTLDQ